MASEVFQLALLLTLKDAASGGLERFEARLRAAGKAGDKFHSDFQKIRDDLNKDLAIGGVGIAGLAMLGKGVKMAGDFQSSMTELRSSFAQVGKDGKMDLASLGQDMLRAEVVALRLGNALPGTTEDFVQMMQVLKQNGLSVDTILNGAADAVGNLAVASNAVPREIAADFAKFGNLFKLRAEDFSPAADIFSRIYSSTGQTSAQLVEAAKYFQGRTGQQLGIGGLKDAEQYTRLFGFMGKQGMDSSMAGMGLSNFFDAYTAKLDKVKNLEKETGIKLDFFDKAGKFVGLEEVIRQMSQFDKLTQKDRSAWMEEIFGALGKGAGTILSNAQGWRQFNAEQDKTISLAQKNAEISKNFNNQLEALTGSLKNLVVTGLGPLLPGLTSGAKATNELVGNLVEFAKANPGLMQTLGSLALYGTTAMAAYGGIKTLTTGFRLLKMASAFSRGDLGFLDAIGTSTGPALVNMRAIQTGVATSNRTVAETLGVVRREAVSSAGGLGRFAQATAITQREVRYGANGLQRFSDGFAVVGSNADASQKKVSRFKSTLSSITGSSVIRIGVQIAGIAAAEYAVTSLLTHLQEAADRQAKIKDGARELAGLYDNAFGQGHLYNAPGAGPKTEYDAIAQQFLNTINEGGLLTRKLHPERTSPEDSYFKQLTGANFWEDIVRSSPYGYSKTGGKGFANSTEMLAFNPATAARYWQSQDLGKITRDPNVTAAVIRQLQTTAGEKGMTIRDVEMITAAIEKMTRPEDWKTVLDILAKDKGEQRQGAPPAGAKPFSFGQPVPTIRGLSTGGLKVEPFSLTKSFGPTPPQQPLDLTKLINVQGTVDVFAQLNQPVASNVTSFANLVDPSTRSAQSLGDLVGPSDRLPGSFSRINVASGSLATALFGAGERMASWRPPSMAVTGPNGQVVSVPSNAVGGVIERDGMAYLHAGNVIVPAKKRPYEEFSKRFQDTASQSPMSLFSQARTSPERDDLELPSITLQRPAGGKSSSEIVFNYTAPQITIQGNADERTIEDIHGLLLEERKAIARLVRKELANGRARA